MCKMYHIMHWVYDFRPAWNGLFFMKDVIDQYGVDATRLAILGTVPPKANREWSEQGNTCTFVTITLRFNSLQIGGNRSVTVVLSVTLLFLKTFLFNKLLSRRWKKMFYSYFSICEHHPLARACLEHHYYLHRACKGSNIFRDGSKETR